MNRIISTANIPQLKEVYEGKALYLDYGALANIAIKAGFSHSNGETELIACDSDEFFEVWSGNNYFAWYFQAMNPWIHR